MYWNSNVQLPRRHVDASMEAAQHTASGQWPGYQFSIFQFDTVDGWNPKQPPGM